MILHEVWKDGTIGEMKEIVRLKIPRQYAPIDMSGTGIELHVFMDASKRAPIYESRKVRFMLL